MLVPRFARIDATNEEAGRGSDRCKRGNFDALALYCLARVIQTRVRAGEIPIASTETTY